MSLQTPLLNRRAVVQANVETTYGVAASLGVNDGILVSAPMPSADITTLERDIIRASLSPLPIINGRKLNKMKFSTELRGNGKQQSGLLADVPALSDLFRACGFAMTLCPAPKGKGVYAIGTQANPVTWVITDTSLVTTDVVAYYITVDTPGASGTAKVTVTSDTAGEGTASAILTTAVVKALGTKGMTITPTFTGSLLVGQSWIVWALPRGVRFDPVSTGFESTTIGMSKDGVYHLLTGANGNVDIEAQAGQYAKLNWDFTGIYNAPTDAALASPSYETQLPSQVELARLSLNSYAAIVDKFTLDMQNQVQVRSSVNAADGYIGTRITQRTPQGGIDPEADTVANHDFWGKLAAATLMPFQMRVGTGIGNTVWMFAPNSQYSGLTYADRNDILTYDAGLRFGAYAGDDEVCFFFC